MTVTGILKDIPVNTHFKVTGENKFEFLIPFKRIDKWVQNVWTVNMVNAYVLLDKGVNKKIIDQNFKILFIGLDMFSMTICRAGDDLIENYPVNPYTVETFEIEIIDSEGNILRMHIHS